ncbi:hypothetical protein HETIRDRAFT_313072, partial [Heterobasidion irregulare TC 32-1]
GPTVFGKSWHLWYLSSTIQYLPKAFRIPPSDPSAGACSSPELIQGGGFPDGNISNVYKVTGHGRIILRAPILIAHCRAIVR